MRAVVILFGIALVAASAFYVDAALTKALDHTFDDLADGFGLDPTVPGDFKAFHSTFVTSGGRHNHV